MNEKLEQALRVMKACDTVLAQQKPREDLVSIVFPQSGGGTSQVFLKWVAGKALRDYIRDPCLRGKLSLHRAMYSRVLNQKGLKCRITHIPEPNDEFRILLVRPGVI